MSITSMTRRSRSIPRRAVILEPQSLFLPHLTHLLESDGYHVIEAMSKLDDDELTALTPDLVLVDVGGEELEGYTAVARLRHAAPHARVIAFGGSSDPAWHLMLRAQGADAVLGELDGTEELLKAVHA